MDQENGMDPKNEQPQDATEFGMTQPVEEPEMTAGAADATEFDDASTTDTVDGSENPTEPASDGAVPTLTPDPELEQPEETAELVISGTETEADMLSDLLDRSIDAEKEEPAAAAELEVEQPESADGDDSPVVDEAPTGKPISEIGENALTGNPEAQWFVVHCYSGYENKVRHNLEQRIETMGMRDKIFDVVIPTQEEVEVKDGKRRVVERHVFPGYVLVNLLLSDESWFVVRNTPGVTGFVGMGNDPTPLRPDEVAQILKRMEAEAPHINVTFKVGERVRIIDGPFNDFRGIVSEINVDRSKVRVMVNFFGRETPVELDFLQVERS